MTSLVCLLPVLYACCSENKSFSFQSSRRVLMPSRPVEASNGPRGTQEPLDLKGFKGSSRAPKRLRDPGGPNTCLGGSSCCKMCCLLLEAVSSIWGDRLSFRVLVSCFFRQIFPAHGLDGMTHSARVTVLGKGQGAWPRCFVMS